MALECRIVRDDNGIIEYIKTEEGARSILFDNLAQIVSKEMALELYALTETEEFKQLQSPRLVVDTYKARLGDKEINSIRASLRGKFPDSYALQILDNLQKAKKNNDLVFDEIVNDLLDDGVTLNQVVQALVEEGLFNSVREAKSYLELIGGQESSGLFYFFNRKPEPSLQSLITFATRKNSVLSEQQRADVENTIISLGFTTYGELLNVLRKVFVKEGVVVFDRLSMERSGFYNDYEINSIIGDIQLQESIRTTIEAMGNVEGDTIPSYDPLFVVSETSKLNSLGKQVVSNPFIVEQQVLEEIAGTDVSQTIENIPHESIKNSYFSDPSVKSRLDKVASNVRRVAQKEIIGEELVDKTANRTKEVLQQVLDLANRQEILSKISYIQNISPNVWDSSKDSVYSILKDLNQSAIESGVDFLALEDAAFTKNRGEILDVLQRYRDVLLNPSDSTLSDFSEAYSEFFSVNNEPLSKLATTKNNDDIYLESDLTEYELFVRHGLLKKGNNIYSPIEVIDNLDEVYYLMAANTTLLPPGVNTEAELRDYVEQEVSNLDITDFNVDTDQLEKMILYKMYFQIPTIQPMVNNNLNRYAQFNGDYDYLTEEYPSDFYKQLIKEKRKNSEVYQNFYRNFVITKNGIELINNDPITIQNIMKYASEELKQYNLLSKSLGLPVEENDVVDLNEMIYNRQQAISNPDVVAKLNKDYTVLSPITIAVKDENSNFVRTPAGVFEIDYQLGNISFYNLLPKGNTKYNSFGLYRTKTQSDLNLNDFAYLQDKPEVFVESRNYYSQAELQKIDEKHFGCI